MGQKEFNKNLDGYLTTLRSRERPSFDLTAFLGTNIKNLTKKFNKLKIIIPQKKRRTDIGEKGYEEIKIAERIDEDPIESSFEETEIKNSPSLLGRIKKLFIKDSVPIKEEGEEEIIGEGGDFKMNIEEGEELKEFEEGLEEIAEIEEQEKEKFGKLKTILSKLKFIKNVKKEEEKALKEEVEIAGIQKDKKEKDVKFLVNFSITLLQKLPSRAFKDIKEDEEFLEYKEIIKRYVNNKEEKANNASAKGSSNLNDDEIIELDPSDSDLKL